jgi:hypothetical protein
VKSLTDAKLVPSWNRMLLQSGKGAVDVATTHAVLVQVPTSKVKIPVVSSTCAVRKPLLTQLSPAPELLFAATLGAKAPAVNKRPSKATTMTVGTRDK